MDKKKITIYLQLIADLLLIIRSKDKKVSELSFRIRELERAQHDYKHNPSFH